MNHPNRNKRPTSPVVIDGVEYRKRVYGGYDKNLGHEKFWCSHAGDRWFPVYLNDYSDWSKGFHGSTKD